MKRATNYEIEKTKSKVNASSLTIVSKELGVSKMALLQWIAGFDVFDGTALIIRSKESGE